LYQFRKHVFSSIQDENFCLFIQQKENKSRASGAYTLHDPSLSFFMASSSISGLHHRIKQNQSGMLSFYVVKEIISNDKNTCCRNFRSRKIFYKRKVLCSFLSRFPAADKDK
jgi:hypothetical protein